MLATLAALLLSGAGADTAFYRAEPAAAPAQNRVIAGELVWRCGAGACTAASSGARPLIECQGLVRAVGKVKSFAAGGTALPPEQLERCNARAR